jgi:uncharacterized membrane protein (TIGR02234 family)
VTGQPATGPGARRQLTAAVVGAALAGGLALFSSGQHWAEVTAVRRPPLPPVSGVLTGGDAAPLVPATGLLLLAAGLALVAVRGWARPVLGVVLAAAGAALGWAALRPLTGHVDASAAHLPALADGTRVDVAAGWPVAVLIAALLAVAVGALVVLRGKGWHGMGRRYERGTAAAAARPATDDERRQDAWRALDRGEDPTAGDVTDVSGSGPSSR